MTMDFVHAPWLGGDLFNETGGTVCLLTFTGSVHGIYVQASAFLGLGLGFHRSADR